MSASRQGLRLTRLHQQPWPGRDFSAGKVGKAKRPPDRTKSWPYSPNRGCRQSRQGLRLTRLHQQPWPGRDFSAGKVGKAQRPPDRTKSWPHSPNRGCRQRRQGLIRSGTEAPPKEKSELNCVCVKECSFTRTSTKLSTNTPPDYHFTDIFCHL